MFRGGFRIVEVGESHERHLMRVLRSYGSYCHSSRTHRSLDDDCPDPRSVEPPEMGDVVALAQVGGPYSRYKSLPVLHFLEALLEELQELTKIVQGGLHAGGEDLHVELLVEMHEDVSESGGSLQALSQRLRKEALLHGLPDGIALTLPGIHPRDS